MPPHTTPKRYVAANFPALELTRRLSVSHGISASRTFLLMVYYFKIVATRPVGLLQSWVYDRRIKRTVISTPPVFIIGHYRSGTTYLHKLMAADPGFGFLKTYDMICPNSSLLFGRWFQKCLQFIINKLHLKTAFFNNSIPDLDDAAEEERYLMNKGSGFTDYWRFVFPRHCTEWQRSHELLNDKHYYSKWSKEYMLLLKKITFQNNGKPLILKSPPNTTRIKYLLEMFPEAKFIYIHRNPYQVFYSTCNMWKKAIKRFYLQKISTSEMEEIVFREYVAVIEQYRKDKHLIPENNRIEVRYEDLEHDPLACLKNIYGLLALPGFDTARKHFIEKISKENPYRKYGYVYSPETFRKIESRWGKYIQEWKAASKTEANRL